MTNQHIPKKQNLFLKYLKILFVSLISFFIGPHIAHASVIPLRVAIQSLNGKIYWNAQTSSAVACINNNCIIIKPGNSQALVNGKEVTLDTPPVLINGIIYADNDFLKGIIKVPQTNPTFTTVNSPIGSYKVILASNPDDYMTQGDYWVIPGPEYAGNLINLWNLQSPDLRINNSDVTLLAQGLSEKENNIDINDIKKRIGYACVDFSDDDSSLDGNSFYNIYIAASYLNKSIVEPGQTFSFNDTVGPRTIARGFVSGLSVVNGHFERDIGGGVCGVSTVLFQAIESSGLPVTERHQHDIPVEYIQDGQDAAVWYGVEDFKFKNSLTNPLEIKSSIKGKSLTVSLWEFVNTAPGDDS